MRQTALWVGRFQPPTIAHYDTMECILGSWEHLIIGIVHDTSRPTVIEPKWLNYLSQSEANTLSVEKNPFSPDEVCCMWRESVSRSRYVNRVSFLPMARIAYQLNFPEKFPKAEIDFVEVTLEESDSAFDRLKNSVFAKVLDRTIHYVTPSFRLHNSQIKEMIRKSKITWQDVLKPGCYEKFIEIQGPVRTQPPSS